MTPSGNLRIGNACISLRQFTGKKCKGIRRYSTRYSKTSIGLLRDIATVADAADVTVDFALINGKRSVYMPVVKTADASTWDVVQTLKIRIPEMKRSFA